MITKPHRIHWIASGLAAAALAFAVSNASGQKMLIDDFNDGDDVGWSSFDLLGPAGLGIFDASSGSYNLTSTGAVDSETGLLISLWDNSVDPKFSHGFLQATIRADTQNTQALLFMRGDVAAFQTYGIGAAPSYSGASFALFEVTGPGLPNDPLGSIEPPPINVGEDWIAEIGAVGDEISLKAWRLGEPEPVTPQVTTIDTTLTSGQFGVGSNTFSGTPPDPALIDATFDDIYFTVVPEPTAIWVDIKPGSERNPINLKSKGVLPVAIISTEDFFAPDINVDELRFGDPDMMNAGGTPVQPLRTSVEDVSGDGIKDLTLKFSIPEMIGSGVLGPNSTEARLAGYIDGVPQFIGRDSFDIVPKSGTNSIPEPSTGVLAIVAMLALVRRREKQQRKATTLL